MRGVISSARCDLKATPPKVCAKGAVTSQQSLGERASIHSLHRLCNDMTIMMKTVFLGRKLIFS